MASVVKEGTGHAGFRSLLYDRLPCTGLKKEAKRPFEEQDIILGHGTSSHQSSNRKI